MTRYLIYPGCSLESISSSYYDSLTAVSAMLDIEFEEINDWNCCGATEYTSIHRLGSFALEGRNLALAAQQVVENNVLVAPCSACYLNLSKTEHYLRTDAQLADQVNQALGAANLNYKPGSVDVKHALDIIFNDVGLDAIKDNVSKPLSGLRVAAYYGCLVVRPDYDKHYDDHEYPGMLEELLKVLGAEVIDFPMKAHCCGGHMPSISAPVAYELIRRLVHGASIYKADLLATLCPMCQLNLDAYQADMNRFFHTNYQMPILYFTQLMGLAFGISPDRLGIGSEFVDARPALSKIQVHIPAPEPEMGPQPLRKKEEGLPMPRPPVRRELK